jgi:hypothetical protein
MKGVETSEAMPSPTGHSARSEAPTVIPREAKRSRGIHSSPPWTLPRSSGAQGDKQPSFRAKRSPLGHSARSEAESRNPWARCDGFSYAHLYQTHHPERSAQRHSARSEVPTVIPREAKRTRSFRAKRSGVAESTLLLHGPCPAVEGRRVSNNRHSARSEAPHTHGHSARSEAESRNPLFSSMDPAPQ